MAYSYLIALDRLIAFPFKTRFGIFGSLHCFVFGKQLEVRELDSVVEERKIRLQSSKMPDSKAYKAFDIRP